MTFKEQYPNLEAVLKDRVSGYYMEWPMIRKELKELVQYTIALEKELNNLENFCNKDRERLIKRIEELEKKIKEES